MNNDFENTQKQARNEARKILKNILEKADKKGKKNGKYEITSLTLTISFLIEECIRSNYSLLNTVLDSPDCPKVIFDIKDHFKSGIFECIALYEDEK
jgi:hypothetical protein